MTVHWEEIPLELGLPELAPEVRVEGEKAKKKAKPKIRWSSYRPADPVHCDECLTVAHKLWPGRNCIPDRAVLKRTHGDDVTYFCSQHGEERKRKDGYSRGR